MWRSLTIFIVLVTALNAELNTVTHIKNGELKGKILKDINGDEYVAFQSVPYAKPPIGNLRFKAPEPALTWDGVLEATKDVPSCVQNSGLGVEDCLYLNVFTPEVTNNTADLRPVMFFIHGGGFTGGSSSILIYGAKNLIAEGVVVVSINYRLGALGFLSLDDKTSGISSNNGLKDQVMALKWVQENIAQFGGNPEKVTIFGESAGAASVHLLLLSPMTKGLFNSAISQSGTAISTWANGLPNSAIPFAEKLGIDTNDTSKLLEELQNVSLLEIIVAQRTLPFELAGFEIRLGQPTVEGTRTDSFLPDHPRNILKSGNFNQIPIMMGYNDMDGILFDLEQKWANQENVYNATELIPYYLDINKSEEISKRQLDFYFDGIPPTEGRDMVDFWTDVWFKYDHIKSVQQHADIGQEDVYLYEFSMDTNLNFLKKLHPVTSTYPGASHGDELGYIFHQIFATVLPESIEDICTRRMIRLWTNFAKYGNPTPVKDDLLDNLIWNPFTPNQSNYMQLGNELESKTSYEDERFEFWQSLYNDYDVFQ